MVNKVMLVGRLGRDPELRYTGGGTAVANFSLATDERGKDGEKKTEWHKIVAWGKTADTVKQYLHKGSLVFIEGSLQTREWEDKSGQKRQTTEINARDVRFLDSKGEKPETSKPEITDDDIPF